MGSRPEMDSLADAIETTARWIIHCNHVIIFTGAGISTASGIPDFRGPDGVWTRRDKGLPPPAYKVAVDEVRLNAGHMAIVELERMGKVQFLISQNVDGLHMESGFPAGKLAELHGNKHLARCLACDAVFKKVDVGWNELVHGNGYRTDPERPNQPRCPSCGGRIISSIVNFKDPLPEKDLAESMRHSQQLCDLFIVLGSSLVVNPAARMVLFAKRRGAKLVINNKGETPYDEVADILVPQPINDFFPPVVSRVRELLGRT
ncbi:MAG: NAD-dependent deacetylase [Candidatus Lokiarchaeota archaeon]|nr:NAD-dependent deacetylase [Candidatus Lokiarchaeota archaeon]